jgi:hypothetical protein
LSGEGGPDPANLIGNREQAMTFFLQPRDGSVIEECLVRIGRHGQKTHRAEVEIIDDPTETRSWRRRKIGRVFIRCKTLCNQRSQRGLQVLTGFTHDQATCENCNPRS